MPYTVKETQALASKLQAGSDEQGSLLGQILATVANICESADGLEMAAGMRRDRPEFYAEAIQSICEELSDTLKKTLSPEALRWYFSPDDSEDK